MTRRHHPLRGIKVEVLMDSRHDQVVVAWPDGAPMALPRAWTDADGAAAAVEPTLTTTFTVEALRELLVLVGALQRRG